VRKRELIRFKQREDLAEIDGIFENVIRIGGKKISELTVVRAEDEILGDREFRFEKISMGACGHALVKDSAGRCNFCPPSKLYCKECLSRCDCHGYLLCPAHRKKRGSKICCKQGFFKEFIHWILG
jgi:hypothetical protein